MLLFDDLGAAYYTRFADDANLVKSWFRYYDEPVLRLEFYKMGNVMTLQWCEHYGVLAEHLLLEIRSKPLTLEIGKI
ncbi:hypothetical protein OKW96_10000 [Sphingobacterium sp. KU25419]|nr:hypothetical protein OKW96_10000 [Sphingobacterium sp. KU25419]